MKALRRTRPSYADVTATLALFIALGGTSYAALELPRDSVGARELKRGAVGEAEVRNGALSARDLAASSRPAVVRYARVVRDSGLADAVLDGARGFTLGATYASLVHLNLTDPALRTPKARRGCAVSAQPVARRSDVGPRGPERPGGAFLEINNDIEGTIAVYAFDRDGKPAATNFDFTLVCPRR